MITTAHRSRGSREEKGKNPLHLSFVTHWPLTTIIINDFRIEHMTLNDDN